MRRRSWAALPAFTFAVAAIQAFAPSVIGAPQQVVTVTDQTGDLAFSLPGFMDITRADVIGTGRSLTFRTTLAQPIPTAPSLPHPCEKHIAWVWGMDTDPTTYPVGFPAPPSGAIPVEFGLRVLWDGSVFRAELIDRRPLLSGQAAVFIPQPFAIASNQVSMTLDTALVGNPSSFSFDAVVMCWMGNDDGTEKGNFGWLSVDALDPFWNAWPS